MRHSHAPRPHAPASARAGDPSTWIALGALIGASALIASARWFWLGEIAASFRWQIGWAAFGVALFLFASRRTAAGALALLIALAHVAPEGVLSFGPRPPAASSRGIEIASANVLWSNREFDAFVQWVEREDPDVLAVLELSRDWKAVLESRLDGWPHRLVCPPAPEDWDEKRWGFALFSKQPLEEPRTVSLSRESFPLLEAAVSVGGRRVVLRAIHPPRPGGTWRIRQRDFALERVAASIDWTPECVLLGDINTTSTSPAFARLLGATGLRDSRAGFGRLPTWTSERWIRGLSIAIDHCLVGPGIEVLERRTEPIPGSDHRAIVARIAPRAALPERLTAVARVAGSP